MATVFLSVLLLIALAQAQCPTGCSTCSGSDCTACLDGFFPSGTSCLECPQANCATCSGGAGNQCTGCDPNYYLQSGGCNECVQCVEGEFTAVPCGPSSPTQCDPCSECGFGTFQSAPCTPSGGDTQCSPCCGSGLFPTAPCTNPGDAVCQACSNGCAQCSSASVCTQCYTNFFLSGGSCTGCSVLNCDQTVEQFSGGNCGGSNDGCSPGACGSGRATVTVYGPRRQPIANVNVFEVTASCASGKTPQQVISLCPIVWDSTDNLGRATFGFPSATETYQFYAQVGGVIDHTGKWTPHKREGCGDDKSFTLTFRSTE